MTSHILAIAIGLLLDRLIGDPPNWPHPVRWIGIAVSKLTERGNRPPQAFRNGFIMITVLSATVFTTVLIIVILANSIHPA